MTDEILAKQLLEKFGLENQLKKLCEECAEYIQAYIKADLNNSRSNRGLQGMLDEMADIEITMSSIKIELKNAIHLSILKKSDKARTYLEVSDD